MRIFFLPVDERFCTRDYFIYMTKCFNIEVMTPPRSLLGQKKIPADCDALFKWLDETVQHGDILILSLDMLIYGGLIPSRIDLTSEMTLIKRLKNLQKLRIRAEKIYINSTIMRIPKYNSDDEEPVYWEYYGQLLHQLTLDFARDYKHLKTTQGYFEDSFYDDMDILREKKNYSEIPEWVIIDYFSRRIRNGKMLSKTFDLLQDGSIDYFNLTLDDNGKDSLNMIEASIHRNYAEKFAIKDKYSIHPGADEASLTLLARALCQKFSVTPEIALKYAFENKKHIIPPYEGDPLDTTLKNHIIAAGGKYNEQSKIRLLINNMETDKWIESPEQPEKAIDYNWLLSELQKDNINGIVDIRYPNGSDRRLVTILCSEKRNWNKTSYSAWNTPSNTIGTVVAMTILQFLLEGGYLQGDYTEIEKFHQIQLIEQYGYQAIVRKQLREESGKKNCTIWTLIPAENWACDYSKLKLLEHKKTIESAFSNRYEMSVFFPWHRSFEIGINLK